MLIRRASFDIGPKSILYLFLAFAFNGKASNATFTELGCEFADNEYKMQRNPDTKVPIWSEEGIHSMELPMDPKDPYWQPIVDYLFEDSIMNDVSPFTKFVKTYKNKNNNGTENLASFFDNYDVPFQLKETRDPASYIIQMFHKLKDHHRNQPKKLVLEYYYLVSASVDPSDMDIETAMSHDWSDEEYLNRTKLVRKMLDETRFQDHLAGILKITSGKRTGYILIDPGYANGEKLVHPFVVFLTGDGKYPDGVFMNGFTSYKYDVQFAYFQDVPFILAEHINSNTMTKVLYYIGKPYCSFIENTIKPNLLRLNHGLIIRDPKNQKQKYLTFKISPNDNSLILTNIDNTTTVIIPEVKQIPAAVTLNETFSLPPTYLMEWGIPKEEATTISKELKYIQTEVFSNNRFMSKLIDLSKKLDLNKVTRQYSLKEFKEEPDVKQLKRLASKPQRTLTRRKSRLNSILSSRSMK